MIKFENFIERHLFFNLSAQEKLNPPVIITGRHVSLNAIRVTWTAPETENVTHLRSFTAVLTRENCSLPLQQQVLPGDVGVSMSNSLAIDN